MAIDPNEIIREYYLAGTKAHYFLVVHGQLVAKKALAVAENVKHLNPDIQFIEEGALLHDIGMIMTKVPDIGCFGSDPYVRHGVLGRQMLDEKGLPKHALVCERHLMLGLSAAAIEKAKLPLPVRDMKPITLEEKIITYADLFYSKNPETLEKEKTLEEIETNLRKYSQSMVLKFKKWVSNFEPHE